MIRTPLNRADLSYVAENMREWDRKEIFATRWTNRTDEVVDSCMACPHFAWIFGLDRPIAAVGGIPLWPGVWSVWMFATDEFPKVGLGMTKFIMREMITCLNKLSHRVECRSMEGHSQAQKWLEVLGATRECTLPNYGSGGENFHVYRWQKLDIDRICKRADKLKGPK